jgi:ketosteroid isomerase-like protein
MSDGWMEPKADSVMNVALVNHFNELFNRGDLAGVLALMTDDCVFENTYPPPDGTRYVGQAAVGVAFAEFFNTSPQANFQTEEIFAAGDRCVVRWVYQWTDAENRRGHVRGVDLFRLYNGKVAEKLAYVKG